MGFDGFCSGFDGFDSDLFLGFWFFVVVLIDSGFDSGYFRGIAVFF